MTARHGPPRRKRLRGQEVDLLFTTLKPTFGDVFLMCGDEHPRFPPSNDYGFAPADLGIKQTDDDFAPNVDGDRGGVDFPLVRGQAVQHHPGPYHGLRLVADDPQYRKLWSKCVSRFEKALRIPVTR